MNRRYNPDIHHRRTIRLKNYDYSQCGAYFTTICAYNRECLFGDIVDGKMRLNEIGTMVKDVWEWLPQQYPYVSIGEFVVMPNHFHGVLTIADNYGGGSRTGGSRTAPTQKRKPLGQLIGAFKTVTTKRINEAHGIPGGKLWQRNYYEHIIRNEDNYRRIVEYIQTNPLNWENDQLWTNP